MRKYLFIFSTIIIAAVFTACGGYDYSEKFTFAPEKTSPGGEITVYYNPAGTLLADAEAIEMVAILYNTELENVVGVDMTKDGKGWKGEFETTPSTYGVVVKFKLGEQEESNNKKGYWIDLYKDKTLVPGLLAGKANLYSQYAHIAGIDRDFKLSKEIFDKAFEQFPETKSENLNNYLFMLNRSKIENYESIIKQELDALEAKGKFDEKELALLADWYGTAGENEKAETYRTKLLSEYPAGTYAEKNAASMVNQEKNFDKKTELLKSFEKNFSNSESIPGLYNSIANALGNAGKFSEAKTFMSDNIEMMNVYRFYAMADKIMEQGGDADLALEFAKMGMIRGRQELDHPKSPKPKESTISEWETDRKYYLALNMYKYGSILYEMGKREEILPVLEEAVNLSIDYYIPQDLIDLYSTLLVESEKYESALTRIGGFIEKGKNSEPIMNALKEAYTKKNGGEDGFDEYIGQYEQAAELALFAKLKKEMISAPSIPFTLKDLDGKDVSLSDYKGKIVIIDFWATWCPPCLASFPGLKIAVEKYSADNDVKFLFVDTWERVPDKKKNAADFIKQNNYPFHVLIDEDYKVIGAYKVSSIPTKFILDKEGNIRFRNVGYSGNIDRLVKEIDIMIDLIKQS